MHPELVKLIKVFNKHKINYWLDSGTLLGVIRDGDIAEGDDDIDFSIWVKDTPKLSPIIKELNPWYKEQKGLKYIPESIILCHRRIRGLHLSIHCHHKSRYYAYCFMQAIRPKNIKRGTLKWVIWITPHIIYNLLGKRKNTLNPMIHPLGKINFFWNERMMLRIPMKLLKKIISKKINKEITIKIPKYYKEYLNFCYGNWRIPNKNWKTIDDGRVIRIKDWEDYIRKKISKKEAEVLFEKGKAHIRNTTVGKNIGYNIKPDISKP